jgi:hypothetical protein
MTFGQAGSHGAAARTCEVNVLGRCPELGEVVCGHLLGHGQEAEDAAAAVVDQHHR